MIQLAHSSRFERVYYVTAYGEVPLWCPLHMRAMRLSSKYGRNFAGYLDGWMKQNFIAGRLAGHPDLQIKH